MLSIHMHLHLQKYIHNMYIRYALHRHAFQQHFHLNTGLFIVDSRIHIEIYYCMCIIL